MYFQKLIIPSILLLALGAWYLLVINKNSCDNPIKYKIGSFDKRFKITEQKFLENIAYAETIWEKPISKNLFEYSNQADLTINLIYDDRQKTTEKNAVLKTDTAKISNLASNVKKDYTLLQDNYSKLKAEYSSKLMLFNKKSDKYIAEVDYWNKNNGAPEEDFDRLSNEKLLLENEQRDLEQISSTINDLVVKINEFIKKYNLLVDSANSNIQKVNQTAGKEFEEGLYDPNKNEINIYEFATNDKLIRVLAHEFGHALTLDHNENPKSVMYSLNESNVMILSEEDLLGLKLKCKLQ